MGGWRGGPGSGCWGQYGAGCDSGDSECSLSDHCADVDCPRRFICVTVWSPAGDAVLGGCGAFRKWVLAGGVAYWGQAWGLISPPNLRFLFASQLPRCLQAPSPSVATAVSCSQHLPCPDRPLNLFESFLFQVVLAMCW